MFIINHPSTVKMQYPCIVYKKHRIESKYADDLPYNNGMGYQVTVIDPNPDSDIPEKIGLLQMSSYTNHFTIDNLNHEVYNVYY